MRSPSVKSPASSRSASFWVCGIFLDASRFLLARRHPLASARGSLPPTADGVSGIPRASEPSSQACSVVNLTLPLATIVILAGLVHEENNAVTW